MADPGTDNAEDWRLAEAAPEQRAVVPPQAGAGGSAEPVRRGDPAGPAGPAEGGMPLWARLLIGDVVLALFGLVVFVVIGVQRLNDATLSQRRTAYVEDVVMFVVFGAVYLLVAFLLRRSGQRRLALVQLLVAVLVLGLAGVAAATGNPKDEPAVQQIPASELPSTMNP